MKIFIHDGLRHMRLSGYGMLSRNFILGLAARGHELALQRPRGDWDDIEPESRKGIEELNQIPIKDAEIVLQIGTPAACRQFDRPTLMYTQNALGDLRSEWVSALRKADGCIVPGEFDRQVFARYFDRVYVARQSSDPRVFRPAPSYRSEGPPDFTFLFVGSYSYRKGVDLLLEAFLKEFDPDEPAVLILQTPGVGQGNEFNHLLNKVQTFQPRARVRIFGNSRSPHWMSRLYNQSDCVLTLSRGEGWCMPLTEALLCNVPVIAPRSTAMGEYLSDDVARLIPTEPRRIADIRDKFATGFVRQYGENEAVCYEPDIDAARRIMREVYSEPAEARARAEAGRRMVMNQFSWESATLELENACRDLLGAEAAVSGLAEG